CPRHHREAGAIEPVGTGACVDVRLADLRAGVGDRRPGAATRCGNRSGVVPEVAATAVTAATTTATAAASTAAGVGALRSLLREGGAGCGGRGLLALHFDVVHERRHLALHL